MRLSAADSVDLYLYLASALDPHLGSALGLRLGNSVPRPPPVYTLTPNPSCYATV